MLIIVFYAETRVPSKSVKTLCILKLKTNEVADFLSSDEEEN